MSATETSSSGGSTSTESETSDATGESTHATFIPDPDHPPELFPCDPWLQDCGAGEKCVPIATGGGSWNANTCVPVNGDQAAGEPCSYAGRHAGTDDCDATSLCWNVIEIEGELVGECLPFCLGSAERPDCPADSHCPISAEGTVNVCLATCDPVAQDCDEGRGCYWGHSEFTCVVPLDDIPSGEPCGFINDCAPGLGCFTEVVPNCAGSACCSAFCDLALGDEQCAGLPGTSCSSFFEQGMAPPDYEHVGVCILP